MIEKQGMKMSLLEHVKKPEYYFRPFTIIKKFFPIQKPSTVVKTAWGTKMEVNPSESIGRAIALTGIYDLAVTEVLWRLIEPGNFVIDVGANIGYISALSSFKAGLTGKVWAFEPNPVLLPRLNRNVQFMTFRNTIVFSMALSNSNGTGFLEIPDFFKSNEGIAYIGSSRQKNSCDVELKRLDDLCIEKQIVNVIKIDVEGHELQVLEGADRMLSEKRIHNILFEDHNKYPSKVSTLLLAKGYEIFRIEKGWLRVLLKDPQSPVGISAWEPTNYLATLNAKSVRRKMDGTYYECVTKAFY